MELETNLDRISAFAEEREDSNWDFRHFLKSRDNDEVDERVHRLNEEVSAQIDCTACANCCLTLKTMLSQEDIHRMAEGLSISPEEVQEKYCIHEEGSKELFLDAPCPMLDGKKCSIYPYRPDECRNYPNLHKPDFVFRLIGVLSNYEMCPIVFNVYERLKDEYGWYKKRRRH